MFHEVACIGAGVIGKSWAVSYALKQVHVRLYVCNPEKKKVPWQKSRKCLRIWLPVMHWKKIRLML